MRFPIAPFTVPLLIAAACSGQSKQNIVQTGSVDAHGANWIPPTSTFASPPSSAATGSVYIFTDASAVGTCSGGGSALATCRWSGSAWSAVGGGGGGTAGGSARQVQVNSSVRLPANPRYSAEEHGCSGRWNARPARSVILH
jgi:hypothetical protein